ncbi:hypothetical protein [Nocardioides marmoraquaticus]
MPSRTRRRAAAASMLLAASGLTACGFGVQTNQPYQPAVGPNQSEGRISVLGTTVVVEGEETAQQGTLSTNIVNDDLSEGVALDSVTSDDDVQVELLEPIEVGPQAGLDLSDTGAVLVTGELTPGAYVALTFVFDNGTEIPIDVPVVNDLPPFDEVTPAEGTPSSEPSSSPGTSPSEDVSPSAGPSSNPDEPSDGEGSGADSTNEDN